MPYNKLSHRGQENGVRHQYFDDLKQMTLDMGFPTIKDAVIALYEKHGSTNKVGAELKVCGSTIYGWLKKYKYPHIKGKGGPNNPKGIKYIYHEPKGFYRAKTEQQKV